MEVGGSLDVCRCFSDLLLAFHHLRTTDVIRFGGEFSSEMGKSRKPRHIEALPAGATGFFRA